MAAPLKVGFPRISNKNFKILKCFLPNLQCQHNAEAPFMRLYRHKAFRDQIFEKQWNFTKFITPIFVVCSGLSLYKIFRWFSGDVSGPQLFQKIHAKTSDISGAKNNNFIADAVDIAAPAVVFLQVKRYSRIGYEESKGSGFIVRPDGLILTNAHVVREGGEIIVKMKNGREYIGTVHAIDRVSDLATIKINEKNLPVIKLGDSTNLRAGEWVVALGCPLSLKFTVTVGIVSSKHRAGQEMGFRNRDDIGYIQTDAAITIGNSGGPLINLEGEAIGINTWTVKDGISFAIPSDYAKKFVERAESYNQAASQRASRFGSSQKQKHYYLGLTMMTLNEKVIDALSEQIASFPPDCQYGVFVHGVKMPSPAYRGGLQVGDVIVAINDKAVQTVGEIYEALAPDRQLFDKATSAVQMNGSIDQYNNWSKARMSLSPNLFSIFLEQIISDALEEHDGKAAYLQKNGWDVCVLERRHVIGGAAVTEEIVPGYKFSRASYVLSLLRPQVYEDLELKKYGMKVYLRDPNAYTPLIEPQMIKGRKVTSLILGRDALKTKEQIAQFSEKDAQRYGEFEEFLERISTSIDSLLDNQPLHLPTAIHGTFREKLATLSGYTSLAKAFKKMGKEIPEFYELMTAPTTKILDKWFESEPLKATLATDAVIGAMISPDTPGSGYVLLHHVMGEIEGVKGAWGYVEGGMGSVSAAIANCAIDHGASVFTDKSVSSIITKDGLAEGVTLKDGTEIRAKAVLSNATPKITFLDLLPQGTLEDEVESSIRQLNYESPVTKINVAVNRIPNFLANPNSSENAVMPHHRCTIHLNCEHSSMIHEAYLAAQSGGYSKRPMIEMTIPSSLDPTLAPEGHHVVLLFTQFTPYYLANGRTWNDEERNKYADTIFDCIEDYAPGFKESVVGRDILTPPDLERVFGLTGGNIFHGAMSLDQLYMMRPTAGLSGYRTPVKGLYQCGSGAHPGGGVMGSPGRLAALTVLDDKKLLWT